MYNKRNVAVFLTKFYLRIGRGHGLVSFVANSFQNIVYLGALQYLVKEWFGIEINKELLIGLGFLFEASCYFIGWIDEKIGFWKFENTYNFTELNPFFVEMNDRMKRIEEKL